MIKEIWRYYKVMLHGVTLEQQKRIFEISSTYRFCYNWALALCKERYEQGLTKPKFTDMTTEFTKFRNLPGNEWLLDFDTNSCRYAIKAVDNAYAKFFKKICKYPKFKSKRYEPIRFKVRGEKVRFKSDDPRYVNIPGFTKIGKDQNWFNCGNHNIPIGPGIKYKNVCIKFDGDNYWLSLSIATEVEIPDYELPSGEPLGIDIGIRKTATLSNGIVYDRPNKDRIRILRNRVRKLESAKGRDIKRRKDMAYSTKTKYEDVPKSKNELKREARQRKANRRVTNIYKSHYHKVSREIANQKPEWVVIESLSARELEHSASKYAKEAIHQARFHTLLTYITYKCENNGTKVIKAFKGYKSTRLCSKCGHETDIGMAKIYRCPHCGNVIDRDLNAAINLRNYGYTHIHEAL